MDLIEGIGQRYLMGKANAAPQQVENLVKKQLKGDAATASGKAGSGAPNVARDKEIEDLRKQLAEVKAAQNKSVAPNVRKNKEIADIRKQLPKVKTTRMEKVTGPTGRRESIESVASRGRSKTPREPEESHPSRAVQSARIPHGHHARPKDIEQGRPAAENVREMPRANSSSSTYAPTARPVTLPLRDVPGIRPDKHSIRTDRGKDSHGKAPTSAPTVTTTTTTHQRNITDRARLDSASERPRPASDLCVVEVTEEEPRTRRRDRGARSNVIEVVEKRGNRTRYVVD
ncbi:MAG: hypothetical protein Q9198_009509 [Flavoplaca austrocitrina]